MWICVKLKNHSIIFCFHHQVSDQGGGVVFKKGCGWPRAELHSRYMLRKNTNINVHTKNVWSHSGSLAIIHWSTVGGANSPINTAPSHEEENPTGDIHVIFAVFELCAIFAAIADGAANRPGGGSAESSPYFTRRHHSHNKPPERYQSCMTLPSEGLVDPLDRVRDQTRAEGEERGAGTGSSGPASPRSVNSAPCGLEDRHAGASRLGLVLPLGLTQSSPTASRQRMEWKVKSVRTLIMKWASLIDSGGMSGKGSTFILKDTHIPMHQ